MRRFFIHKKVGKIISIDKEKSATFTPYLPSILWLKKGLVQEGIYWQKALKYRLCYGGCIVFIILFARAYARTRVINKVYPIAFSLSGKRDIRALHHKKGDFIKGIGATWIEKIVSKHSTYQKQTLLLRQNIADEMATAILKQ